MATKSFMKSINITNNEAAKKMANALERSSGYSKHQRVTISKTVETISDKESIKKFFKV